MTRCLGWSVTLLLALVAGLANWSLLAEEDTPPRPVEFVAFAADAEEVQAGEPLTLTWEVRGAVRVRLVDYNLTVPPESDTLADDLPPTGSLAITVPVPDVYAYSDAKSYQLIAVDPDGREVPGHTANGGQITLPLACPFPYFFGYADDTCAAYRVPSTAPGIYQGFADGFAIAADGIVYVLTPDGNWHAYQGETLEAVWEANPDVRAALGDPTGPPEAYTWQRQDEARLFRSTKTSINFYGALPDGRAIYFDSQDMGNRFGVWEIVPLP